MKTEDHENLEALLVLQGPITSGDYSLFRRASCIAGDSCQGWDQVEHGCSQVNGLCQHPVRSCWSMSCGMAGKQVSITMYDFMA